jgi:hypothetical protein
MPYDTLPISAQILGAVILAPMLLLTLWWLGCMVHGFGTWLFYRDGLATIGRAIGWLLLGFLGLVGVLVFILILFALPAGPTLSPGIVVIIVLLFLILVRLDSIGKQ